MDSPVIYNIGETVLWLITQLCVAYLFSKGAIESAGNFAKNQPKRKQNLAKTWSNLLGLGMIAATTYSDV